MTTSTRSLASVGKTGSRSPGVRVSTGMSVTAIAAVAVSISRIGIGWIDQKRDRRASTHQFVEHLKPFGRECEEYLAQPRHIAPWVRKAGGEAEFDWIGPEVEHYWNRTCRILGSERARCGACRDDHGHFAP